MIISINFNYRVIMLIIVWMLVVGPMEGIYLFNFNSIIIPINIIGEAAVRYLFSRFHLNWDAVEFSLFSFYARITQLIGK